MTNTHRRFLLLSLLSLVFVTACQVDLPAPVMSTPTAEPPAIVPTTPPEAASVVNINEFVPPMVTSPCAPENCPYEGQTVTIIVSQTPISVPLYEIQAEFEAATGATLEIVERPLDEHFAFLITDLTTGGGRYDASIAGAWWLGDLVTQDFILDYEVLYQDPRFPQWDIEDVQPGPRTLLEYNGRQYMVANDHDGQVMYYRSDLLEDPTHQANFRQQYGYSLDVPQTWMQFRDVAAYFDGRDLNGDGQADDGLTMHLKVGGQGMFHFISFSAPFVIGPENPALYWFDPETMEPLLNSPGHIRALETMTELVQYGPSEMLQWDLGRSWDHFLRGEAALTFTFGDLGALAQQEGSAIKGKIGTAHLPGTTAYYNLDTEEWIETAEVNYVGNTTGGSWAGVISKFSDAPEATYFLLAMMATKEKSLTYAARGSDGVDPGRYSHYLPPNGTADLNDYLQAGWDAEDVRLYTNAYFENFNNPLQVPYLRIPGTFGYLTALDIRLFEAVQGQISAEQALNEAVLDFEELTNRLNRDIQVQAYRDSLGLTP